MQWGVYGRCTKASVKTSSWYSCTMRIAVESVNRWQWQTSQTGTGRLPLKSIEFTLKEYQGQVVGRLDSRVERECQGVRVSMLSTVARMTSGKLTEEGRETWSSAPNTRYSNTETYPSMLDEPMITVEVLNIEQDPTGFRHLTANRPCEAGYWKQNNSLARK